MMTMLYVIMKACSPKMPSRWTVGACSQLRHYQCDDELPDTQGQHQGIKRRVSPELQHQI
jgi:hypothetical protein